MAFDFYMPDIGEGVVEGEIVSWKVKVGDKVRLDQPLVEQRRARGHGRGHGQPVGTLEDVVGEPVAHVVVQHALHGVGAVHQVVGLVGGGAEEPVPLGGRERRRGVPVDPSGHQHAQPVGQHGGALGDPGEPVSWVVAEELVGPVG